MKTPKIQIRNLVEIDGTQRTDWDVITMDRAEKEVVIHYHTNDKGRGLWKGEGYLTKKSRTFTLKQKTISGKRRYIKRWFEHKTLV